MTNRLPSALDNEFSDEDDPIAGPSRPTPNRTLRAPHTLTVAQRDASGILQSASQSDVLAYRDALGKRLELRRKGDRWVDRMCEEAVPLSDFKKGAKFLESHQYTALTHERHLNSLCSYPTCSKPPRAKWNPRQSIRINYSACSVAPTQGNAEEGYCSRVCRTRSEYVGKQLEEGAISRGKGWKLGLLEEQDTVNGKRQGQRVSSERRENYQHEQAAGGANGHTFRIIERPTLINPVAPSLHSDRPCTDAPVPVTSAENQTIPRAAAPKHLASSSTDPLPHAEANKKNTPASRRDYALAAPTSLTSSILQASKIGTLGAKVAQAEQAGTDLDADGLEKDHMPEWAEDMGFGSEGETDEMRMYFEQMRLGREIMDNEGRVEE